MHTRTAIGISFILVFAVLLLYPKLNPPPDPGEITVLADVTSEVSLLPTTTSGVVTIAAGDTTSTSIEHELGRRPSQVLLTPNGQPPDVTWWVDSITDTTFEVHLGAVADSDVTFFWQAVPPN